MAFLCQVAVKCKGGVDHFFVVCDADRWGGLFNRACYVVFLHLTKIDCSVAMKEDVNWYVVKVTSGQEQKIKAYVENEVKRGVCGTAISEVLVLSRKVYEVRNGKKHLRERVIFPGYVLVCGDFSVAEAAEAVYAITSLPGVLGFLGSAGGKAGAKTPIPLRKHEVSRIFGTTDESSEAEDTYESMYVVGESVAVVDGPFSGFDAVIEEIQNERKRLRVMVKIFGRDTPLHLSYYQVSKHA